MSRPKVFMKTTSGVPYTIPATHEITIRDLLRHTSGLTYQWNSDLGPMYKDANVASGILPYDGTIGDSVQPPAKVPLLFNPGTRIFEPLDMKDTLSSRDYPVRSPKKLFSGGARLNSSEPDYARFCRMILNGGKLGNARMLSPKSVELMTHDQLGKISPEQGFGLGFGVDGVKSPLEELGTPGQFGWGGFFYTEFSIDPKEDMIVIFMGQLHPAGDLH